MYTIHECLKEGKDGHILILTLLVPLHMWSSQSRALSIWITDDIPNLLKKEKLTNIAITTYKSQANERIGLMRMNWMMITTRVRGSGWSPPCWSGCPRCRSGGRWPGGSCPSSPWTRGRSRCGCPTCLRTPPSHLNMKKNELPDEMSRKSCKKIHLAQKTSDQCWLGWRTHQSLKSTIYPGVGQGSLGESA